MRPQDAAYASKCAHCGVQMPTGVVVCLDCDTKTKDAARHLLAAASDMLGALKQAETTLINWDGSRFVALEMVQAAIRKAQGDL